MADWNFKGFSAGGAAIPVPDRFFSEVLPRIDDVNELKTALYVFWLVKHRKGYPRFVTVSELLKDEVFTQNINCSSRSKREAIQDAVKLAVEHGILLAAGVSLNGVEEEAIFFNMEPDSGAYRKLVEGDLALKASPVEEKAAEPGNIYTLYEQNIGVITPIVAEDLKRAEAEYPAEWISEAFRNAVEMNRRNWRYVSRILEIWATEGKDDGKHKGYTKKDKDSGKYVRGKYGHMVNR